MQFHVAGPWIYTDEGIQNEPRSEMLWDADPTDGERDFELVLYIYIYIIVSS